MRTPMSILTIYNESVRLFEYFVNSTSGYARTTSVIRL
jgi:hypothetical protein